jgi:Arc/MetJ-type ribon-helix-helix transcriptional regulator
VVREPVQVYLDGSDQERLERLTSRLEATKSDVLRRGLQALEHQLSDPSRHPALRIAGLFEGAGPGDAARDHDRVLAEMEEESWSSS